MKKSRNFSYFFIFFGISYFFRFFCFFTIFFFQPCTQCFCRTTDSATLSCCPPMVITKLYPDLFQAISSFFHAFPPERSKKPMVSHELFFLLRLIVSYVLFYFCFIISLQIGFPMEENFSSYSVMTFPLLISGS